MIYQNPVLVWRNEMKPPYIAQPDPPPVPFTVTRSEIAIRDTAAPVVHIWYALIPAEEKAGGEAHGTPEDIRRT